MLRSTSAAKFRVDGGKASIASEGRECRSRIKTFTVENVVSSGHDVFQRVWARWSGNGSGTSALLWLVMEGGNAERQ